MKLKNRIYTARGAVTVPAERRAELAKKFPPGTPSRRAKIVAAARAVRDKKEVQSWA